jgi:hypothetical protein
MPEYPSASPARLMQSCLKLKKHVPDLDHHQSELRLNTRLNQASSVVAAQRLTAWGEDMEHR